jgi:hypothetical protein
MTFILFIVSHGAELSAPYFLFFLFIALSKNGRP